MFLIKYGRLPFEEWLRNNQLATATSAIAKGQEDRDVQRT
jgi:hypothetical protein